MSRIWGKLADDIGGHVVLSPERVVLVTSSGTESSYPRPLQSLKYSPMPLIHMTGPTTHPFSAPTEEPYLSYAIDDQHEASRSNCVRRTQSRTAILAGNTPLRLDYRAAARSGFTASAALAPPPKALFRSSPPLRSTHLGSTIPLGHPASPRLTPAPNPQMDHWPPAAFLVLQYTTPDNDTSAAAEQLSNIL